MKKTTTRSTTGRKKRSTANGRTRSGRQAAHRRTARSRPEDVEQAAVEVALRRIQDGTLDSMTVRSLADELGVNHRALYRHIPDKEALLLAAAIAAWTAFGRYMQTVAATSPPGKSGLVRIGIAAFEYAHRHPNLFFFMHTPRFIVANRDHQLQSALTVISNILGLAFAGAGTSPGEVTWRASAFVAALYGLILQTENGRIVIRAEDRIAWLVRTCTLLVEGFTGPTPDCPPGTRIDLPDMSGVVRRS